MTMYDWWYDPEHTTINFITEGEECHSTKTQGLLLLPCAQQIMRLCPARDCYNHTLLLQILKCAVFMSCPSRDCCIPAPISGS
eukprot:359062-Chlamydomonas_euryale.AAC.2